MIRIVKPAAPAVLLTKGEAATRELCRACESAPNDFKSGARTFDFDNSIYAAKEVKDALRDAQHNKCAFCESVVPHISYGNVEHFRPKAGYKQRATDEFKRPGYYWLAYEWDNLFYSCELCNQRFKQNLFPLKDGRRRARSHTYDLGKEEPLLLDPCKLDPADFIEFREARARDRRVSRRRNHNRSPGPQPAGTRGGAWEAVGDAPVARADPRPAPQGNRHGAHPRAV